MNFEWDVEMICDPEAEGLSDVAADAGASLCRLTEKERAARGSGLPLEPDEVDEVRPSGERECSDAPDLVAMEITVRGTVCSTARVLIDGYLDRLGQEEGWREAGYRCRQVTEKDVTFWRCRYPSGAAVTWFFFSED